MSLAFPLTVQLSPLQNDEVFVFLSDLHFGYGPFDAEQQRERAWITWIESLRPRIRAFFLLGDLFDYWYEYQSSVPKGFVYFQVYLAELSRQGIPVYYLRGNREFFSTRYFNQVLGYHLVEGALSLEVGEKRLYLAHGDGRGKGQRLYNIFKWIYRSFLLRTMMRYTSPDLLFFIVKTLGAKKHSKQPTSLSNTQKNQYLIDYANHLASQPELRHDYYLFGHTHLRQEAKVAFGGQFINLGDGIYQPACAYLNAQGQVLLEDLSPKLSLDCFV